MITSSTSAGPGIDVGELWRMVSMSMIARGHERAGRQMLDVLRGSVYDDADIEATTAMARAARGDFRGAIEWVEQQVLCTQPAHPLSLLVKAVSQRALGLASWQATARTATRASGPESMRQAAHRLLQS